MHGIVNMLLTKVMTIINGVLMNIVDITCKDIVHSVLCQLETGNQGK